MNDIIKAALPWLSTALGGPLATVAATFVADKLGIDKSVDAVKAVIENASPPLLTELKTIEYSFQTQMATLGYKSEADMMAAEVKGIEAINATMQAETKAEHWPSYTWRPYIGFQFGTYIASLWLLPLMGKTPVTLSESIVLVIGAILGVASYFRGKAQSSSGVTPTIQLPATNGIVKKFLGQ